MALGKQMRGALPEVGKIPAQVCVFGIILVWCGTLSCQSLVWWPGRGTGGSALPKNKLFMGGEQGWVKAELCELSSRASLGGTKLKC